MTNDALKLRLSRLKTSCLLKTESMNINTRLLLWEMQLSIQNRYSGKVRSNTPEMEMTCRFIHCIEF